MAPLLFFCSLMVIFSLERLAIRLLLPALFACALPGQTLRAMFVGLRFDTVMACTLSCPLILLVVAGPLFRRPGFRKLIAALAAVVLGLVAFACVVDYYYFREFGERLNHRAIIYLDADYIYEIIWNDYPIVTIALAVCLAGLILYKSIGRLIARRLRLTEVPALSVAQTIYIPAIMVCLTIIGIRGTFGPKAINSGPAYFCTSSPVAQLALNGLFTLREAAISLYCRPGKVATDYTLLPPEQALKNTLELIDRPGDVYCGIPANPLRRVTDTGRARHDYNVVLVVLESISWQYIGAMGASPGYTPNLDRLISEGLFVDECFAVGNRTTRGFSAIVSGYPDLPGKSVSTRAQTEGTFLTLGGILKSRGYETMFIYGGQPSYDHRQAFLGSNGYTRMVFTDSFAARTFKGELGLCDEDLYNQSLLEFEKCQDRPFFATLLTLSFHPGWLIPAGKITPEPASTRFHEQIDALRYTDWAIGSFIERAKNTPYFKDTIFIFVADHMGGFSKDRATAASYRVPLLIYAPYIIQPARISGICSQMDVAPTIMHLLGGSYEHCFFGSSVIGRQPGSGFAWLLNGQQIVFINGLGHGTVLSPGNRQDFFQFILPGTLASLPTGVPTDQLAQMPVSIMQVADSVYRNGSYNLLPPSAQTADGRSSVTAGGGR
jgi:hypothetical protein